MYVNLSTLVFLYWREKKYAAKSHTKKADKKELSIDQERKFY